MASFLSSTDCSLLYLCSLEVCLVNDPRPNSSYGKLYTVQYLNNMVDGLPVLYINQPIDMLRQLAIKSLKSNQVCISDSFCFLYLCVEQVCQKQIGPGGQISDVEHEK